MQTLLLLLLMVFDISTKIAYTGGASLFAQKDNELDFCCIIEKKYHPDLNRYQQLVRAIQTNNYDFIKNFKLNHTIANFAPKRDLTLLQTAVFYRSTEIITLLLQKGACVNAQNSLGNTALHTAIDLASSAVKILTHTTSPTNVAFAQQDANSLYAIILQLIDAEASLDIKNYNNETPLEIAHPLILEALNIL